jgi:hypothetical protein
VITATLPSSFMDEVCIASALLSQADLECTWWKRLRASDHRR